MNSDHKKRDATAKRSAAMEPSSQESFSIAPPPFQLKSDLRFAEREVDFENLQESVDEGFKLSSKNDELKKFQDKQESKESEKSQKPFQLKKNDALPEDVQMKMESSMGHDFSGVNFETNSSKATDLGALAYAQGEEVHFAPGQFNPGSTAGQELIGHELAHVVQQREGRVQANAQAKGVGVNNDSGLESEADRVGRAAASADVSATTQLKEANNSSNVVQRFSFMDDVVGPLSNNALGAGVGLFNAALDPISTMGKVSSVLNGTPMDHLVSGGMGLRNAARSVPSGGQSFMKGLGGVTSIAGLLSGGSGIYDYFTNDKPNTGIDTAELVFNNTPAAISGLIGTLELGASGLGALGLTSTAAGGAGAAAGSGGLLASLGPVGAALGSFAGGWTIGRGLDNASGWLSNQTGLSSFLDEQQGISRPNGQNGDYSLSGLGAMGLQAFDQHNTNMMRAAGLYDDDAPAYTQTLGWKLAEVLPSWMQ